MEISIDKTVFLRALHLVQTIVEKRNTMPILANVLIRTGEGNIDIVATDLEVGIKETVSADIKEAGTITVSAKKLFEIVKEIPTDSLSLRKKENNWIEIWAGKAVFNMVGIDPEDFPSFPSYEAVKLIDIKSETLKEIIEKTAVAISADETRYNLSGAYFENAGDGRIRVVATDGHRLAVAEKEVAGAGLDISQKGCIVPRKGVQEFKKMAEEADGTLQLGFMESRAILKKGNMVVVVRLIEGEFPDYRQVIPKASENLITLNRVDFIRGLRRVSILSDEKTKGVRFVFSGNTLTLSTTNPGLGEAKEELEADYAGNDITVGFNARYVLDFLNVMTEEQVVMSVSDELSAALMKDGSKDDYTAIVMPMRT